MRAGRLFNLHPPSIRKHFLTTAASPNKKATTSRCGWVPLDAVGCGWVSLSAVWVSLDAVGCVGRSLVPWYMVFGAFKLRSLVAW